MTPDKEPASGSPNGEYRTFVVGVDTLVGTRGGQLEIAQGALVCRLGRSWGAGKSGPSEVVHKDKVVDVYHARAPFWSNVGVLVSDGHWTVDAVTTTFARRGLVATLTNAGFAVRQHRTWFNTGKSQMRRP